MIVRRLTKHIRNEISEQMRMTNEAVKLVIQKPKQPKRAMTAKPIICRCCGGIVRISDGFPIHTSCIRRHWEFHAHGKNTSRCKEFSCKKTV